MSSPSLIRSAILSGLATVGALMMSSATLCGLLAWMYRGSVRIYLEGHHADLLWDRTTQASGDFIELEVVPFIVGVVALTGLHYYNHRWISGVPILFVGLSLGLVSALHTLASRRLLYGTVMDIPPTQLGVLAACMVGGCCQAFVVAAFRQRSRSHSPNLHVNPTNPG
ncbi:MAG: hypothetical protein QM755_13655 [Luteolibacter sp.]